MNPLAGLVAVGGILLSGAYLVAIVDGILEGRPHVLARPWRRSAFLLLQRRTVTERPDAEAWALAPVLLIGLAAVGLTAIPFDAGLAIADVDAGLVLFGAAMIVVMVAVFLQGWSPNSVLALIAGYRFAAVALSFAIAFSLVLLTTALPAESLSVGAIVAVQEGTWNVIAQPIGLPVYLVTAAALAFWGPLRIPEGADVAGGTVAEASGVQLLLWRVGRAAVLVTLSAMGAAAFLGGYLGPWLPGWAWMAIKTVVVLIVLVAGGRGLARVPVHRFVWLGWVVLLPLALVDVFASGSLLL